MPFALYSDRLSDQSLQLRACYLVRSGALFSLQCKESRIYKEYDTKGYDTPHLLGLRIKYKNSKKLLALRATFIQLDRGRREQPHLIKLLSNHVSPELARTISEYTIGKYVDVNEPSYEKLEAMPYPQ